MIMNVNCTKSLFIVVIFLAILGTVLSGYCNDEKQCKETCIFSLDILKIFGLDISFPYRCTKPCSKQVCCTGFTGKECSQLTEDCTQNGRCSGHRCTEEYTQGCLCNKVVTMNETFMGSNTKIVRVQCDKPCTRTSCCSGYKGPDCNELVTEKVAFLTPDEINSIKKQLKIDEGYRTEIYLDTENLATVGIGHLIRETDEENLKPIGTKVSDERIQTLFLADVNIATADVLKVFPAAAAGFPGEVKEILVNMMFNLGRTRLKKFKKFIAALNKGDWNKAADEMVDSKWYGQVGNRAERLVARMRAVKSSTVD